MKVWLFGKSGSDGYARGQKSGIGRRLDHFVAEIAQAVESNGPANFAVDANYQLIQNSVNTSAPPRGPLGRERGAGTRPGTRARDPRARG